MADAPQQKLNDNNLSKHLSKLSTFTIVYTFFR
jgi:hypothetical protein